MTHTHCPGFNRRDFLRTSVLGGVSALALPHLGWGQQPGARRPNIVLCMTDDQGWGDTSYNGHPALKTPHLDAMAANGLRFDRFYAAAPVCSPTRASVLTGRHPNRTAVYSHGHALRLQERTIAHIVKEAGYTTGHFGKWHLNGLRGPGVPVLESDAHHPGHFGFDEWVSASNFIDMDPRLARNGKPEQFKGDSSDVTMDEALKFIRRCHKQDRPFLAVVWYGSPHNPFKALPKDSEPYAEQGTPQSQYLGEIAAVDRSMGRLRAELRDMGIEDNTLVWFCSDNGGVRKRGLDTVAGLRGGKGSLWEGGIRVPGIIEWPAGIPKPARTGIPAVTSDILPTLADVLGLDEPRAVQPQDGMSLLPVISDQMAQRPRPIGFQYNKQACLVGNRYKLHRQKADDFELYDLQADPNETTDVAADHPDIVADMKTELDAWMRSIETSKTGADYPEGKLLAPDPAPRRWTDVPEYQQFGSKPRRKGK